MRISFLFIFFTFLYQKSFSQDTVILNKKTNDLRFDGGHFGFTIIPLVNQKADVTPSSGPYHLQTKPLAGIEGGFNYYYNFNRKYSIITGLHAGVSARNYSLFVPKDDFTPPVAEDFNAGARSSEMYISIPLLFDYRWRAQKSNFLDVQLGANVRFYPHQYSTIDSWYGYDDAIGSYEVIRLELEVGSKSRAWLDYNLGCGYTVTLRNWNFLRAGLLVNYSGNSIATGDYRTRVARQSPISFGTYASKHSFIGLSLSYTWTGTRGRSLKGAKQDR